MHRHLFKGLTLALLALSGCSENAPVYTGSYALMEGNNCTPDTQSQYANTVFLETLKDGEKALYQAKLPCTTTCIIFNRCDNVTTTKR